MLAFATRERVRWVFSFTHGRRQYRPCLGERGHGTSARPLRSLEARSTPRLTLLLVLAAAHRIAGQGTICNNVKYGSNLCDGTFHNKSVYVRLLERRTRASNATFALSPSSGLSIEHGSHLHTARSQVPRRQRAEWHDPTTARQAKPVGLPVSDLHEF